MKKKRSRVVHGDDLLYRFFRDLFVKNPEEAHQLAQRMLEATSIWLPKDVYREWPILLPWVVRDAECRGNKSKDVPDRWSSPDESGHLRDDNSLIKALPRSLAVAGPAGSHLQGARMGTEFVASHVWREVNHPELASRLPLLNSFVPNLAWLPSQIAKLSDLEGSPLQQVLQAMACSIYRKVPVRDHLRPVVEEAWSLIPPPGLSITLDESTLNWFESTANFLRTRRSRVDSVIEALETLEAGEPLTKKVVTTRYTEGLPYVSPKARADLLAHLRRFASAKEGV